MFVVCHLFISFDSNNKPILKRVQNVLFVCVCNYASWKVEVNVLLLMPVPFLPQVSVETLPNGNRCRFLQCTKWKRKKHLQCQIIPLYSS